MATRINSWDSSPSWQWRLIWCGPIRTLQFTFVSERKRACCFSRGALDAFADRGGRFFGARAGDVAVFDGGNFDVEIDAVEKRAGDALAITLHLDGTATALALQIAEVAAGMQTRPYASINHVNRFMSRSWLDRR